MQEEAIHINENLMSKKRQQMQGAFYIEIAAELL